MRSSKIIVILMFCLFIMSQAAAIRPAQATVRRGYNAGPTIIVTLPKAGESLKIGFPIAISWSYSGNVGQSVMIFLHKNSTPTADKLLVSMALDGSGKGACSIPTPKESLPGSDYVIVVKSNQSPNIKGGSGLFSLVDAIPKLINRSTIPIGSVVVKPVTLPLIIVNQPAGDKDYYCGTSYPVNWTNKSSNMVFQVNIVLLKGDITYKLLASGIPVSQGSFSWTIPAGIPHDDQYRIHIVSARDDKKYFGTSNFFTIFGAPTISSFSPTIAATGDTVVITGTNFYSDKAHTKVKLGNSEVNNFEIISSTTIQAKAARQNTNGNVIVETPAGIASLAGFTKLYSPHDFFKLIVNGKFYADEIFWVDGSRQHGLMVAAIGWDSGSMTCPYDCALNNIATYNTWGGFTDWRLPTRDELNILYLADAESYGLAPAPYWTSEDAGNSENWTQDMSSGQKWHWPRTYSVKYHAVRSF